MTNPLQFDVEAHVCREVERRSAWKSPTLARWTLHLAVGAACFLAGAQWHAKHVTRQPSTVERAPEVRQLGDLWLRCPGTTTWYSCPARGTQ